LHNNISLPRKAYTALKAIIYADFFSCCARQASNFATPSFIWTTGFQPITKPALS
jgi:hypothetical protein